MIRKCKASGKITLTELEAQIIVARAGVEESQHRHRREVRLPRRYYQCEFCAKFHVTSQAKNEAVD